jgi:hypothetical protein
MGLINVTPKVPDKAAALDKLLAQPEQKIELALETPADEGAAVDAELAAENGEQ